LGGGRHHSCRRPAAKFRERADRGNDEAQEHDFFHLLFPATAIERPYNAITARAVPAHGDLAANYKLVDEILTH
jgi:hypothetical protein